MNTKISRLPETLINQIAAGEVIENPASIVKELVENSIDAKATHIQVEIKAGGQQYLCVIDDGIGMSPEDALLSLERHATSKISSFEDFNTLSTMGFRGEALPSIASISRLVMKTSAENFPPILIEVHGGEIIRNEPTARNRGTTIEIRSLFYNTPARKKFQKSAQACTLEILKTLILLSLAHPNISFSLKQNEEITFEAPACQSPDLISALKERAQMVLGAGFSKELHTLFYQDDFCTIQGFLAPVTETRPNRKEQYLFVNKRAVISPLVSYAIKDALSTRLDKDRFPLFVIHIELEGHLVDVNVHPQKKEVRFREEPYLRAILVKAVLEALQLSTSTPSFESVDKIDWASFVKPEYPERVFEKVSYACQPQQEEKMQQKTLSFDIPCIKPIGLYNNYLLLKAQDLSEITGKDKQAISFIDLKGAEALIEFDRLKNKQWLIEKQALLFPIPISVSLSDAHFIQDKIFLFEKLGIEIRASSKDSFLIESLPHFIDSNIAESLFHNLIAEIHKTENLEDLFKLLCQFPIRYKSNFVIEEAQVLMRKLLSLPYPWYSLKGRPLLTYLDDEELYGLFKRKDSFS